MTAPEVVIGIDIGTGGIRALALELESGNFLAKSQSRLQTSRSNEGARTQELDDWIVGVSVAAQDLMAKLGQDSPQKTICAVQTQTSEIECQR